MWIRKRQKIDKNLDHKLKFISDRAMSIIDDARKCVQSSQIVEIEDFDRDVLRRVWLSGLSGEKFRAETFNGRSSEEIENSMSALDLVTLICSFAVGAIKSARFDLEFSINSLGWSRSYLFMLCHFVDIQKNKLRLLEISNYQEVKKGAAKGGQERAEKFQALKDAAKDVYRSTHSLHNKRSSEAAIFITGRVSGLAHSTIVKLIKELRKNKDAPHIS